MRKGLIGLLVVFFTFPMLAQNTPQELNRKEFQELMEQLLGQSEAFFKQLPDSMFTQTPNGGVYHFYNFSNPDSLMTQFPVEELEKMLGKSFGMVDPNEITNPFDIIEKFDFKGFQKINPDSLEQQMQQFEQFFGEQFKQLIPEAQEGENSNGKKKRKIYSL